MKKIFTFITLFCLLTSSAYAGTCEEKLGLAFTPAQRVQLCKSFGSAVNSSLIPAADNTYDLGSSSFGWRTVYADTSVITPLVSSAAELTIRADADAGRVWVFDASADDALTLTYGLAATTATGFGVVAATADADDDSNVCIAAGGTCANTRGSFLHQYGNEAGAGNAGRAILNSGNVAGADVITRSADDWFFESQNGAAIIASLTELGALTTIGDLALGADTGTSPTITWGDGGVTAGQDLAINASTADADDDSRLNLCGGGAVGSSRGACIALGGNEDSTAGDAVMTSGAAVGSDVIFKMFSTGGAAVFNNSSDVAMWDIVESTGVLRNRTGGSDLGLSLTGTTVAIQEATAGSACMGTLTANGGTPVVTSTTCALTGSRIFLTRTSAETGVVDAWISNITNATSFAITGEAGDTGTYNWIIFHEAA